MQGAMPGSLRWLLCASFLLGSARPARGTRDYEELATMARVGSQRQATGGRGGIPAGARASSWGQLGDAATRGGALAWQQLWRSPAWRGVKVIYACPQDGRDVVYLTFDDGPNHDFPDFAARLRSLNVSATFFWVAANVVAQEAENASRAASLRSGLEGHAMGSHSFGHVELAREGVDLAVQVDRAHQVLTDVHCGINLTLFRPPSGSYNQDLLDHFEGRGYRYGVVLWDIDTLDWDTAAVPDEAALTANIDRTWGGAGGGKAGHIILMHEGKNKADGLDNIAHVVGYIRELCRSCSFESLDRCPLLHDRGGGTVRDCPPGPDQASSTRPDSEFEEADF